MIEASRHPASSVRNGAIEALGKIGLNGDEVISCLENALRTEDVRDVRQEMLRVRDELLYRVPPTPSCP